jgi:hypothetical protein
VLLSEKFTGGGCLAGASSGDEHPNFDPPSLAPR